MKRIAVLGSTGSIGTSCLDVLAHAGPEFEVVGLTTHRRWELLAEQCHQTRPAIAVIADAEMASAVDRSRFPEGTEIRFGGEAVEELAGHPDVETVISGIVGAAGLLGTWAAIESGKRVGLANKETLVVAGPLVAAAAEKSGACLIPVDSEHSAVFQALACGRREDLSRVVLTASGGPFRQCRPDELEAVTPAMALDHPTWDMGPKISIDSATMMNKSLEIIEARWLFDLSAEQIGVVIHPQSIVHSFVEFRDGSVIAQMSPPDMRLPIQYALTWPERWPGPATRLDFGSAFDLEFAPPDRELFPALELGYEVARRGGSCGAVLNAANEVAVERFLQGDLSFCEIPRVCAAVLQSHDFDPSPSLSELFELDRWAREETVRWKC